MEQLYDYGGDFFKAKKRGGSVRRLCPLCACHGETRQIPMQEETCGGHPRATPAEIAARSSSSQRHYFKTPPRELRG